VPKKKVFLTTKMMKSTSQLSLTMLLLLVRLKPTPTPLIIPNLWTTHSLPLKRSLTILTLRNSLRPSLSKKLGRLPSKLNPLKFLSKPLPRRRTNLLRLTQLVLPLSPQLIKKN